MQFSVLCYVRPGALNSVFQSFQHFKVIFSVHSCTREYKLVMGQSIDKNKTKNTMSIVLILDCPSGFSWNKETPVYTISCDKCLFVFGSYSNTQDSSPVMKLFKYSRSLSHMSRFSWHVSTQCTLWSSVTTFGIIFEHTFRMFKLFVTILRTIVEECLITVTENRHSIVGLCSKAFSFASHCHPQFSSMAVRLKLCEVNALPDLSKIPYADPIGHLL